MVSYIYKAIGNLLGEDTKQVEEEMDFESGLLMDVAIQWVYVFKKLIIPQDYRADVVKNKHPLCRTTEAAQSKCRT